MQRLTLDAVLGATLEVDVCSACRAFWFDPYETLHLAPASTLELFRLIAAVGGGGTALPAALHCPKCGTALKLSHDRQRNTPFEYRSCPQGHGRYTRFNDFLKEKNFIQPLTPQQIAELRRKVRMVHCSNCGAPVDLVKESACAHCGSPLVMLDRDAMKELADQYQRAANRKRPVLPLPRAPVSESPYASLLDFDLKAVADWFIDLMRASR